MRTVENLIRELQVLLETWRQGTGEGIAAAAPALVAARLLERPAAELEHASQTYKAGLPRTLALQHVTELVCEGRGFALAGYEPVGHSGFYLRVPVRREPIVVGPGERRDAVAEAWGLHAGDGLLVRTAEGDYAGQALVECWSRDPGRASRFVAETDRAVDACALVHRRAIRLRAEDHEFLAFPRSENEPRLSPAVDRAVETLVGFLEDGEPGEHLGTLWHGPPGNGKTSMVRRLMRELAAVTRVWVDPSAMAAQNLEDTFALLARILRSLDEGEAALVVFEDLDLLSGQRGASSEIRTWLSALDGVERYRCRVGFVGLTNLTPQDFDPAVVRPSRLGDLVIEFGPPDAERRRLILGDHLGRRLDGSTVDEIVLRTQGWSGAELELLCRRVRWAWKRQHGPVGRPVLERLVREVRPRAAASALGFSR